MKSIIILFSCVLLCNINAQNLNKTDRLNLKNKIDSIDFLDQQYRRQIFYGYHEDNLLDSIENLPRKKYLLHIHRVLSYQDGFTKEIRDSLDKLQAYNDSVIKRDLITIISKYGYDCFKKLNKPIINRIILHHCENSDFSDLFPVFKKELELGNMPPSDYASWFDLNLILSRKKQLYGEYFKGKPCVENLEKTNEERKKIGLKKLKVNNC